MSEAFPVVLLPPLEGTFPIAVAMLQAPLLVRLAEDTDAIVELRTLVLNLRGHPRAFSRTDVRR